MKFKKFYISAIVLFLAQIALSQEGLPVYSDYLTDNYYLIHPSMAGAANCSKIRITGRQQWFGDDDAPRLLTASVNGRIGQSNSGIGGILYSDKNGYHSQSGVYLTYAHHIMFSRTEVDLNMLSFGLSVGALQYKLDETAFRNEPFDPIITGIAQSATNLNIDFGFSYFVRNSYAHGTVKNMLKNDGVNSNENGLFAYDNPRQFLMSAGHVFHKYGSEWSLEPSLMFMYKDGTKESSIDFNAKTYKDFEFGKLWGGISYRRSLDGADVQNGNGVASQKLQYITPLLGIDFNQFMFAYTYSYQANSVVYNNSGFHQITLGYKFGCKKEHYNCNCPAVN